MRDGDLFAGATSAFGARLATTADDQWGNATPNADWDVRALVNHVVGELLWTCPQGVSPRSRKPTISRISRG
ncbi:MAG: maleylpyruvate isomerase N-terminal domain-containing protein [Acidimicrobiales bacterium]